MFEVVIALFIIAMIIVGVVSLSTDSLSNAIFSRNKTLAARYSQEAIEWLRSQREQDNVLFQSKASASTNYCFQTLAWTNTGKCGDEEFISNTIFRRDVTFVVSTIQDDKKIIEANVTTSWDDSRGTHVATSVTNFNDLRQQ